MTCLANSLACLGLDPSGFRELAEEETTEGFDERGESLHRDGTVCRCLCECFDLAEELGRCWRCDRQIKPDSPLLLCDVCMACCNA